MCVFMFARGPFYLFVLSLDDVCLSVSRVRVFVCVCVIIMFISVCLFVYLFVRLFSRQYLSALTLNDSQT